MSDSKFLNSWLSVVRRARLGRTVKAVAFALALYADPDGTHVYPGIARLSVECELGPKVIKQSLKALRDAGLIAVVHASTRAGESSEYRLILAEDLLERIEVPTPGMHTLAIRDVADAIRGKYRPPLRGSGGPAGEDDPAGARDHTTRQPAGARESDLRGSPNPATPQRPFRSSTTPHDGEDLSAAVTVPDATIIRFPVERVA